LCRKLPSAGPAVPSGGRGDGRLSAAASVVARTAMDRNKVAMSWLRPGREAAGRLGGEWVDLGRVGRAAAAQFFVETLT